MQNRRTLWLICCLLLLSSTAYAETATQSTPSIAPTIEPTPLIAPTPLITPTIEPIPSIAPTASTETYVNPYLTPMQRTTTDEEGNIYSGAFVNGQPEGIIEITYTDGRKYVGEFRNWSTNGQGEMTYPGNLKFSGIFQDNYPVQGKLLLEDGKSYQEGTFRRGDPILLAFDKGRADLQREAQLGKKMVKSRWIGAFHGENMTKGKIIFPNGDEFIGACNVNPAHQFSERFGYYHPIKQGSYRFKNGDLFKGTWTYHETKNIITAKGTFQKKNQKAKAATWNNGKIQLTKK